MKVDVTNPVSIDVHFWTSVIIVFLFLLYRSLFFNRRFSIVKWIIYSVVLFFVFLLFASVRR